MEAEGRLLHRDWSRYDTAHCVFRPRHMSRRELEAGYAWMLPAAVLAARRSGRAVRARPRRSPPYLGMALLYKRSNPLWKLLIRHRLTHAVWSPLVRLTRARHRRFRARLAAAPAVPGPLRLPLRPSV